jgi:hypothetical protein
MCHSFYLTAQISETLCPLIIYNSEQWSKSTNAVMSSVRSCPLTIFHSQSFQHLEVPAVAVYLSRCLTVHLSLVSASLDGRGMIC